MRTRRVKAPSLSVNKEFLKKFGDLIEKSLEKLDRRVKKSAYDSKEFKYVLRSDSEDDSYSSISQLTESEFFPEGIYAIDIEASYYSQFEKARISLNLNNKYESSFSLTIAYDDEGELLNIKEKSEQLFKEHTNSYSIFYKILNQGISNSIILNMILSILFGFTLLDICFPYIKQLGYAGIVILWVLITVIISFLLEKSIKFLFPKYDFNLTKQKSKNVYIRTSMSAFILFLLLQFIYDLIKLILPVL